MSKKNGMKRLFLTLDEVEGMQNVQQAVCEARKHPANPLLPLGRADEWDAMQARPWESRTVMYDEEMSKFRCWYAGSDLSMDRWWASGYAESDDGIHWVKPRLGLYEYQGSKENNLVLPGWGSIVKDVNEPDPGKRFKAIVQGPPPTNVNTTKVAYSPDGIHWTFGGKPHGDDVNDSTNVNPDIVALLLDEQDPDPQRRWKFVWQRWMSSKKPGPSSVRVKCMAAGPDIDKLRPIEENPILHPDDGNEAEIHFLMLAAYEGHWVMPYEYGWYLDNGMGVHGQYAADVRLSVSRDGRNFQRVQDHQPVIARGKRGEWDDGFIVISDKLIIKDDTIYLYYCGQGEDWTGWPTKLPTYRFASTGAVRLSRMGLATLRLDGWTCLQTPDRASVGTMTTKPVMIGGGGGRLSINISDTQQNRSWVDVEVLDATTGEVIEGFGRGQCAKADRDSVRHEVSWSGGGLGALAGRSVKLRFRLTGAARLYSYTLQD